MALPNIQEADSSAVNIDGTSFITITDGIDEVVFMADEEGNTFATTEAILRAFIEYINGPS